MKASQKIKRTLVARRKEYDEQKADQKQGTRRPGSLSGAK